MAVAPGRVVLPLGTPGGDVQSQAMLQTLLDMLLFGMDPQDAVEHPRIASRSFPDSFEPHACHPGRRCLESRIARETGEDLAARGHLVHWWPERIWRAGAICAIQADLETGILTAGADPRRPSYAPAGSRTSRRAPGEPGAGASWIVPPSMPSRRRPQRDTARHWGWALQAGSRL